MTENIKISPESKIAIAYIKPYRIFLDSYYISNKEFSAKKFEEYIDINLSTYPEGQMPPEISDQMKQLMVQINNVIATISEPTYKKLLPSIIDEVTIKIEDTLRNSFTKEELEEIAILIKNPLVIKLLANKDIFNIMRQSHINLDLELKNAITRETKSIYLEKFGGEFENPFDLPEEPQ